jgi:hypothetical protein
VAYTCWCGATQTGLTGTAAETHRKVRLAA